MGWKTFAGHLPLISEYAEIGSRNNNNNNNSNNMETLSETIDCPRQTHAAQICPVVLSVFPRRRRQRR